jgi:hypothetical protein
MLIFTVSALLGQVLPKLVETAAARKRAEERAAVLAALPKKRSNRLQVGICDVVPPPPLPPLPPPSLPPESMYNMSGQAATMLWA